LGIKTLLCQTGILKKDGFHASHILFVLFMLPMLGIKTVRSFCNKMWMHWSLCSKDVFYRFKQKNYRWRSFMYKLNLRIFESINTDDKSMEERILVLDDSNLQKLGKMMENISYIFDHNLGRSYLGYCTVVLGLLTGNGFYALDFAYRFGKKRKSQSPEVIGDPRSISGLRSYEAKHHTKLELALMMVKRSMDSGIYAGYISFDSWYSSPEFILSIHTTGQNSITICY
jgi:hypothetical protein